MVPLYNLTVPICCMALIPIDAACDCEKVPIPVRSLDRLIHAAEALHADFEAASSKYYAIKQHEISTFAGMIATQFKFTYLAQFKDWAKRNTMAAIMVAAGDPGRIVKYTLPGEHCDHYSAIAANSDDAIDYLVNSKNGFPALANYENALALCEAVSALALGAQPRIDYIIKIYKLLPNLAAVSALSGIVDYLISYIDEQLGLNPDVVIAFSIPPGEKEYTHEITKIMPVIERPRVVTITVSSDDHEKVAGARGYSTDDLRAHAHKRAKEYGGYDAVITYVTCQSK